MLDAYFYRLWTAMDVAKNVHDAEVDTMMEDTNNNVLLDND